MLDLLGGSSVTLNEFPPTDDDWYLNLLWIDRQKCLLLTHASTLFSVFRAGLHSADLRPIGDYLVAAIETELGAESLPIDTFSDLRSDSVRLAKTASRSTLGFTNEMAFELRYFIADAGGIGRCEMDTLNHRLRRTLRNRGEYVRPIELVAQHLAGAAADPQLRPTPGRPATFPA
jgi:hypothetical protein